jgi:phage tail-like protein
MASNDVLDYLVSFYFELSFKGQKYAFQEVSGVTAEAGVEEVVCGGENRFKYRLPTVTGYQNLVLKRALVPAGSPLINWCRNGVGGGLIGKVDAVDVTVNLLDPQKQVTMKWVFHKAWPVKYSFSDLRSQESDLLIETMELAYTYFDVS